MAFLDAKAAFDVVSHDSMLRKLFSIGIEGKNWSLIQSLYQDAVSSVKWNGLLSDQFKIGQGVRQGGILSADFYKLYANNALLRVERSGYGASIGTVFCGAPTCADDMLFISDDPDELQLMLDMGFDYSSMENYLLQPVKSVIVVAEPNKRKQYNSDREWNLGGAPMPRVTSTTHMGIPRSSVKFSPEEVTVNIQKARRAMYSLMPAGLHGENGLDPQTAVHVFQIYVLPVLLYGLEVAVPSKSNLDTLEKFLRTSLKQILSLPTSTASPVVHILTGILPVEAMVHKRILALFGSICRLNEDSVEKRLCRRQISVKSYSSHSWFIIVKELLMKYHLDSPFSLLESKLSKPKWRHIVAKAVNSYWVERLTYEAGLYTTLKNMNCSTMIPGRCHPLMINLSGNAHEASRIPVRLRIATGTYILQCNRASYNQFESDATCNLCGKSDETLTHFLLECETLQSCRQPIITEIELACNSLCATLGTSTLGVELVKLIIDTSSVLNVYPEVEISSLQEIQFHSARLCYSLHCQRFKLLGLVPKCKRKKQAKNQ